MNPIEQTRLHVLNTVSEHQLPVAQAAELLGVSERHAWRILAAYRREGAAALAHSNRGRRPRDAVSDDEAAAVVQLASITYAGANHTHLSELLRDREGIDVSRRIGRWSCAWTRSPRSRRWIAPVRYCPCARDSGAAHPRLPAPRDGISLCRLAHRNRQGDWSLPPTAPRRGVSQVPRYHRGGGARRPGRSPDCGQLRHPPDGADPELAGQAAPLPFCWTPMRVSPWLRFSTERYLTLATKIDAASRSP